MHLLLVFLFGMVALGLITERLDGRTWAFIVGAAVTTTGLYFGLDRLMT